MPIIVQYLYHNDTEEVHAISKDDHFLSLKMRRALGQL